MEFVKQAKPAPNSKEELWMGESQQSVSLNSLMSAVGFFFIGLLLIESDVTVQLKLRWPLTFLFISAFGFLYSTLVYANASGQISRLNKMSFDNHMIIGNSLSEFIGVNYLTLAMPLVILGRSPDNILSIIVFAISLLGWVLYHALGCSILERGLKKIDFYAIASSMSLLYISQFFSFYLNMEIVFYSSSLMFFIASVLLVVASIKNREASCSA